MSVSDLLSTKREPWKSLDIETLRVRGNAQVDGILTIPSSTVYGYYTQNASTTYGSGAYTDVITNTTIASSGITKPTIAAFTMQYTGVYKIDVDFFAAVGTYPTRVDLKLIKNGGDVTGVNAASTGTALDNIHASFLVPLVAGDIISVAILATTNNLNVGSVSGNANSIIIYKI